MGLLLAALLPGHRPRPVLVSTAAGIWAAAGTGVLLLGLAELVGQPVAHVLSPDVLHYYVEQVPQGRAVLLSAAVALAVGGAAPLLRVRGGALVLLAGALYALVPPLLTGHAASEGNHRLVQATLVAHVLAAVLWVSGLAMLVLLRGAPDLARVAACFSPLALICAVVVAASGVAGGLLRLGPPDLLTTGYGALLVAKALVLTLLIVAGARHRARTLPALAGGVRSAFLRLAVAEVAVMAAAFGLAVALSRTPLV